MAGNGFSEGGFAVQPGFFDAAFGGSVFKNGVGAFFVTIDAGCGSVVFKIEYVEALLFDGGDAFGSEVGFYGGVAFLEELQFFFFERGAGVDFYAAGSVSSAEIADERSVERRVADAGCTKCRSRGRP